MIRGTLDFDAVFEQVGIRFAQCSITGDLERDVREPKLPVPRPRRVLWCGMLRNVDCMEAIAQSLMNTLPCSGSCSAMRNPSTSR